MLKSINLIKTKAKNIIFNSKALDFINLPKLLHTPNVSNQIPECVDKTESPMVVYTLTTYQVKLYTGIQIKINFLFYRNLETLFISLMFNRH